MGICVCMQILPSPTTGTFPSQGFNWRSNSNSNQQDVKREDKNYLDFSFQPQARPSTTSASMFQPSTTTITTVCSGFRSSLGFSELGSL